MIYLTLMVGDIGDYPTSDDDGECNNKWWWWDFEG